jgi:hypothetical protein
MPGTPHLPQLSQALILKLQASCGNRAVQRLLERRAAAVEARPPPAPPPRHSRLTNMLTKLFGHGA